MPVQLIKGSLYTCKSNPEHTETEVIPKKVNDYKITYDLAGGTLDGKTGTITEEYKYGTKITIAAAPTNLVIVIHSVVKKVYVTTLSPPCLQNQIAVLYNLYN